MLAAMAPFVAAAGAAGGWDVLAGGPFPAMVHSREMVLPEEHAETSRRLSAGGAGACQNVTNHNYVAAPGESLDSVHRNMETFQRGFRDRRYRVAHA